MYCFSHSFGISIYPNDGTDAATLLGNADAALYIAPGREETMRSMVEGASSLMLRSTHRCDHFTSAFEYAMRSMSRSASSVNLPPLALK